MERKLPEWCKQAKMEMIRRDISVQDLAKEIGVSRQYVSALVNGRAFGGPAMKKIADYLNISDSYE